MSINVYGGKGNMIESIIIFIMMAYLITGIMVIYSPKPKNNLEMANEGLLFILSPIYWIFFLVFAIPFLICLCLGFLLNKLR